MASGSGHERPHMPPSDAGRGGPADGAVGFERDDVREGARLAAVIASAHDAIYTKDDHGIVTSWNVAAQALYGWTPEEAIGRPITFIIPLDRRGEEFRILDLILAGQMVEH